MAKPKKKRASPNSNSRAAATKGKAWTFPKNSLEDAISIAKALEEKAAGNPMAAPDVARAVGYNQANDWRFLERLRSANLYGLVSGSGANAKIILEKLGQDIVAPSSPAQRSEALRSAFRNVQDFDKVEKYYKGKAIPDDEFFLNTLTREFGIPRDRVEAFSKVFVTNLNFLKSFGSSASASAPVETADEYPTSDPRSNQADRKREFLDTCFVMMPFGAWFDRYYQGSMHFA